MALIVLDCDWREIPRPSVMAGFWASARREVAQTLIDDVGSQVKGDIEGSAIDDAFWKPIAQSVEKKANEHIVQQRALQKTL